MIKRQREAITLIAGGIFLGCMVAFLITHEIWILALGGVMAAAGLLLG